MPSSKNQTTEKNASEEKKKRSLLAEAIKVRLAAGKDEAAVVGERADSLTEYHRHRRGPKPRRMKFAVARKNALSEQDKFFKGNIHCSIPIPRKDLPGVLSQFSKGIENIQKSGLTKGTVVAELEVRAGEYFLTRFLVRNLPKAAAFATRVTPRVLGWALKRAVTPAPIGLALTAVEAYLLVEKPLKELVIDPLFKMIDAEIKPLIVKAIDHGEKMTLPGFGENQKIQVVQHKEDGHSFWRFEHAKKSAEVSDEIQKKPDSIPVVNPVLQEMLGRLANQYSDYVNYFSSLGAQSELQPVLMSDLFIQPPPVTQPLSQPARRDSLLTDSTHFYDWKDRYQKTPLDIMTDAGKKLMAASAKVDFEKKCVAIAAEIIRQENLTRSHEQHWKDVHAAQHENKHSGFVTPTSLGYRYQSSSAEVTAEVGLGAASLGVTLTSTAGMSVGAAAMALLAIKMIVDEARRYKLTPIAALEPNSASDQKKWVELSKKIHEWIKKPNEKNHRKLCAKFDDFKSLVLKHKGGDFFRNAILHFIENSDPALLKTTQPDWEKICERYETHLASINQKKLLQEQKMEMQQQQQAEARRQRFLKACEHFQVAEKNRDIDGMSQWVDQLPTEVQQDARDVMQNCKEQLAYESAYRSVVSAIENNNLPAALQNTSLSSEDKIIIFLEAAQSKQAKQSYIANNESFKLLNAAHELHSESPEIREYCAIKLAEAHCERMQFKEAIDILKSTDISDDTKREYKDIASKQIQTWQFGVSLISRATEKMLRALETKKESEKQETTAQKTKNTALRYARHAVGLVTAALSGYLSDKEEEIENIDKSESTQDMKDLSEHFAPTAIASHISKKLLSGLPNTKMSAAKTGYSALQLCALLTNIYAEEAFIAAQEKYEASVKTLSDKALSFSQHQAELEKFKNAYTEEVNGVIGKRNVIHTTRDVVVGTVATAACYEAVLFDAAKYAGTEKAKQALQYASSGARYATIASSSYTVLSCVASIMERYADFEGNRKLGSAPTNFFGIMGEGFCSAINDSRVSTTMFCVGSATVLHSIGQAMMLKLAEYETAIAVGNSIAGYASSACPAVATNLVTSASAIASNAASAAITFVKANALLVSGVGILVVLAAGAYYYYQSLYDNHLHNVTKKIELTKGAETQKYLSEAKKAVDEALVIYKNDPQLLAKQKEIQEKEAALLAQFIEYRDVRKKQFSDLETSLTKTTDLEKEAPIVALKKHIDVLTQCADDIKKHFSRTSFKHMKDEIAASTSLHIEDKRTLDQRIRERVHQGKTTIENWHKNKGQIEQFIELFKKQLADISEKDKEAVLQGVGIFDEKQLVELHEPRETMIQKLNQQIDALQAIFTKLTSEHHLQTTDYLDSESSALLCLIQKKHDETIRTFSLEAAAHFTAQISPILLRAHFSTCESRRKLDEVPLPFCIHNTPVIASSAGEVKRVLPKASTFAEAKSKRAVPKASTFKSRAGFFTDKASNTESKAAVSHALQFEG